MQDLIHGAMIKAVQLASKVGVAKDSKNQHQRFNYRSVDSTLTTFSQIFAEAGIYVAMEILSEEITTLSNFQDLDALERNRDELAELIKAEMDPDLKKGLLTLFKQALAEISQAANPGRVAPTYLMKLKLRFNFTAADGSSTYSEAYVANDGKDCSKLLGQITSYAAKETFFKTFVVPTEGADDIDARNSNRPADEPKFQQTKAAQVRKF